MTKIVERIERAIDGFYIENSNFPTFIVLTPHAWAEASYEIAKSKGVSGTDAFTQDLNEYKGITVAVTHRPGFEDVSVV